MEIPTLSEMMLNCIVEQWDSHPILDCTTCLLFIVYQSVFYYHKETKLVSLLASITNAKLLTKQWSPLTFKWSECSTSIYTWDALTRLTETKNEIVKYRSDKEEKEEIYIRIHDSWKETFWNQIDDNKRAVLKCLNCFWLEHDVDKEIEKINPRDKKNPISYFHRYYHEKAVILTMISKPLPYDKPIIMLKMYQKNEIQILIPTDHKAFFNWLSRAYPIEGVELVTTTKVKKREKGEEKTITIKRKKKEEQESKE